MTDCIKYVTYTPSVKGVPGSAVKSLWVIGYVGDPDVSPRNLQSKRIKYKLHLGYYDTRGGAASKWHTATQYAETLIAKLTVAQTDNCSAGYKLMSLKKG